jgi:hypothetical protein
MVDLFQLTKLEFIMYLVKYQPQVSPFSNRIRNDYRSGSKGPRGKFCSSLETNNKIHELAKNNDKILTLANDVCCREYFPDWSINYFLYKYIYNVLPYNDSQACGCVALAIMGLNIFNQRYTKRVSSIDNLQKKLKKQKENIFYIGVGDEFFKNESNVCKYFPGHAFVIIKYIENKSIKYALFQSYINHYTLSDFIGKHKNGIIFNDFEELNNNVIKPFQSIVVNRVWNTDNQINYYNITGISTFDILNFSPIRPLSTVIKQTTNKKTTFPFIYIIENYIQSIIYIIASIVSIKLGSCLITGLKLLIYLHINK